MASDFFSVDEEKIIMSQKIVTSPAEMIVELTLKDHGTKKIKNEEL